MLFVVQQTGCRCAELRHIIMEYVDGPDLYEYVREHVRRSAWAWAFPWLCVPRACDSTLCCRQGVFSEEHCRQIVEQISSALSYIHSKGIVHRDIKVGFTASPVVHRDRLW